GLYVLIVCVRLGPAAAKFLSSACASLIRPQTVYHPLVPPSCGRKLSIVRLCPVHAVANCLSSACAPFMWPQTVYHPLVPRSCGRKLFIIRLCPTHAAANCLSSACAPLMRPQAANLLTPHQIFHNPSKKVLY